MASTAEKLHVEDWEQIQRLVNDLRHALEHTATADLAGLLPPPGDRLRLPALRELIRADLDFHWRRRQPVVLEDYLERLPELKDHRGVCLDLLYAEYETRRRYGDSLSLKKLQARFPDLFAQLRHLIESGPAAAPADAWSTLNNPPPASPARVDRLARTARDAGGPSGTRPAAGAAGDAWVTRDPSPTNPTPAEIPAPLVSDSCGKVLPITGGYKLLTRLGSGSYGQVWRAEAPGGVEVALKIIFRPLDHADARRERDALELLSRLRHPFLIATHQFYALEDRLLIAMDLADGSLRDRLKACRDAGRAGIPPGELLGYLGEAAEALDYLHDHHVLHRDIKPDNILLFQGHARVGDFGLARMMELTGSRQATTTGTPAYMAPEVWNAQISAHSDQYSLAATYVELRLGRMIFSSSSMMQLMLDHLERPPDLEGLPQAEREVLLKALAKDPDQRYRHCREFHRALAHALAPAPVELSVPDVVPPETHPPAGDGPAVYPPAAADSPGVQPTGWRRRRLLASAVGLVAVVLAVAAWQVYRPRDVSPGPAPEPVAYLPPHCEPEKPLCTRISDGRTLYDKVAYMLPGGPRVVFVLVCRSSPTDPPTFYVMRDKVSYGLFRKFVEANPEAVPGREWQRGINVNGAIRPPQEDEPAFRVTALEALRFANWLGGKLPTVRQWDKAAGGLEPGAGAPGRGPFLAPWDPKDPSQIAVGRDRPMPCGAATHDESLFHCRDMAGNGLEWTRNLDLRDESAPPQFIDPNTKDLNQPVRLRGKTYQNPNVKPYTFMDDPYLPNSEPVGGAKRDISFRVVLELPSGPDGAASAPDSAAAGTGP